MEWMRAHIYIVTLATVAVILVLGGLFVTSRAPVAPSQDELTWNGGSSLSPYPTQSAPVRSPQEIVQTVVQSGSPATLTLPALATSAPATTSSPSGPFDYQQLISDLSAPASSSSQITINASTTAELAELNQFIPTGLVATAIPAPKQMTAEQQALYNYGNALGGEIQSFEQMHLNETQVLKDQAEDRTSPTKAAAVVELGQGLASIGTFMQHMQNVPSSAVPYHDALAQSYLAIGANLQLVPQAQSDAAYVQAIETYDDSANTFVSNYAALAQLFSAQGVVFSQQDPGSVFSFSDTGAGGL